MYNWKQPANLRRRYQRFLKKTNAQLKAEFLWRLGHIYKLKVPKYVKELGFIDAPETPPDVQQGSDHITALVAGLVAWWLLQRSYVLTVLIGYADAADLFNDKQFLETVKSVAGISLPGTRLTPYAANSLVSPLVDSLFKLGENADVYRQEPYLTGLKANWVATQETYINKVVTQAIAESELIVRNNIVISAPTQDIVTQIDKQFTTIDKRTDLFGFNQIDSLDMQLTRERQQSIGATQYIWRTQRDERVRGDPNGLYPGARPSHFERDNQVFDWNNPPEGGHPGEAINCRCYAILRLPR